MRAHVHSCTSGTLENEANALIPPGGKLGIGSRLCHAACARVRTSRAHARDRSEDRRTHSREKAASTLLSPVQVRRRLSAPDPKIYTYPLAVPCAAEVRHR